MTIELVSNRYALMSERARNEHFTVFDARDRMTGTIVGIAVGKPDMSSLRRRPLRGDYYSRLIGAVHPHVISVLDHGWHCSSPFVAFSRPVHVLSEGVVPTRSSPEGIARLGAQISSGLAALHDAGIRIGTFHPGHVAIDHVGNPALSPWPINNSPNDWGTPEDWSAPELLARHHPTVRSDLWSLGAILLATLVGTGPGELSDQSIQEVARQLRESTGNDLIEAIRQSMARKPYRRFASAVQMHDEFRALSDLAVRAPGVSDFIRPTDRRDVATLLTGPFGFVRYLLPNSGTNRFSLIARSSAALVMLIAAVLASRALVNTGRPAPHEAAATRISLASKATSTTAASSSESSLAPSTTLVNPVSPTLPSSTTVTPTTLPSMSTIPQASNAESTAVSTGAPVTLASANGDELRPHMIKRSSRRGGSMPPRQRGEPNGHSVIDGNPTKDAPTTLEDVAARGGPSVVRKGTRPPRASRIKRPHPQNSTMNHKFRPHQSGR